MKQLILFIAFCFPVSLMATGKHITQPDTTVIIDHMKIRISEDGDRKKVRLYELTDNSHYEESELVFEGHYIDGQSYQKRKYLGNTHIPLPNWNQKFRPHWCGFGMGFANFSDGNLNINDIKGIGLKSGQSLEYNLNIPMKSFPFHRNQWAVVTGLGMRWNRYRINENGYFLEENGVTSLHPAGNDMILKTSKLNTTSITVPVLLEWQTGKRHNNFFVSAGIVGVIKTLSSSKIVYFNESGKKKKDKVDGGMNLRPVTMDFLLQAGFNHIGIYAKYSPVKMFEKNKGPEIHPVSLGFHIYL